MNIDKFARTIAIVAAAAAFCAVCSPTAFGDEAMSLEECREKASAGDAEAMWQLGRRYENGDGVKKDMVKAVVQYRKAADKGHPKACEKMSQLHSKGVCVKKDPALAAKYAAKAKGESGEVAAAEANREKEEASVDYIEIALDYLLGRNGKEKDPSEGIRKLYEVAKDNPVAKRVFVERWTNGDLDAGVEELDNDEWDLIIPWFKEQFDAGRCLQGGLLLGNAAYIRREWRMAEAYWKSAGGAGNVRAWIQLGRFYSENGEPERDGRGPKRMRNDSMARKAFERALNLAPDHEGANWQLGIIHLFGKKPNCNYGKALKIFTKLTKANPDEKWYWYDWGLAGVYYEEELFAKKWPSIDRTIEIYKRYGVDRRIREALQDYDKMKVRQRKYVDGIRRAAGMGCEDAVKFIKNYEREESAERERASR